MGDIVKFTREHGRRARHQAQGRPDPARQPRPVPGVRPRHRREPQGLLVLVARGPGLRVRDLEGQGRQAAAGRRRPRADQDRPHREGRDRLQGPLGAELPRQAGAHSRPRTASGGSSSTSRGRRRARRPPRSRRARPKQLEPEAHAPPAGGAHARRRGPAHAPVRTLLSGDMPLTLVLGPANSAKAGEVLGAYAAAAHRGALLVVPTAARRPHYAPRARRARLRARLGAHVRRARPRDRPSGGLPRPPAVRAPARAGAAARGRRELVRRARGVGGARRLSDRGRRR